MMIDEEGEYGHGDDGGWGLSSSWSLSSSRNANHLFLVSVPPLNRDPNSYYCYFASSDFIAAGG